MTTRARIIVASAVAALAVMAPVAWALAGQPGVQRSRSRVSGAFKAGGVVTVESGITSTNGAGGATSLAITAPGVITGTRLHAADEASSYSALLSVDSSVALTGTNSDSVLILYPRGHASDAAGTFRPAINLIGPSVDTGGTSVGCIFGGGYSNYKVGMDFQAASQLADIRFFKINGKVLSETGSTANASGKTLTIDIDDGNATNGAGGSLVFEGSDADGSGNNGTIIAKVPDAGSGTAGKLSVQRKSDGAEAIVVSALAASLTVRFGAAGVAFTSLLHGTCSINPGNATVGASVTATCAATGVTSSSVVTMSQNGNSGNDDCIWTGEAVPTTNTITVRIKNVSLLADCDGNPSNWNWIAVNP